MTSALDAPRPSRRRLLSLAFAAIVAFTVAMTAIGVTRSRMLQMRAAHIVNDVLSSSRTLARIERDVDELRYLVDEHVFETSAAEMNASDAKIAAVRADMFATLTEFQFVHKNGAERDAWQSLLAHGKAMRETIDRVLALSRRNEDVEARQQMMSLTDGFESIARDIDGLFAANDRVAASELAETATVRTQLMLTIIGSAVAQTIGIVVVAYFTLRLDARFQNATRQSLIALEARNRDLDAFAGRVAHDMRGPLTTMSLAIERLLKQLPEPTTTAESLRRGVRRMQSLIDDLLALATVGQRVSGRCDPAAVTAQLVEDFQPRVEVEHGALRVHVASASVIGSEGLLRQALANLIENAIKYRRPDVPPEIEVEGDVEDGRYVLRVSDNGMGMGAEDARHAFDPLYRSPTTADKPGTGLGLSIVKRVVEASDGHVRVASSRVGAGTTFEMSLPLEKPPDGDRWP